MWRTLFVVSLLQSSGMLMVQSFQPVVFKKDQPLTVCHAQRKPSVRRTISLRLANQNPLRRTISLTRLEDSSRYDEAGSGAATLEDSSRYKEVGNAAATLEDTSRFKEADAGEIDWSAVGNRIKDELQETFQSAAVVADAMFTSNVKPEDVVLVCDVIDELEVDENLFVSEKLQLRKRALEFKRYELLAKLMSQDYEAYAATASFLSPSRIPRSELPNVQDVPIDKNAAPAPKLTSDDGEPLVADCELEEMKYKDSLLDKILLKIFRNLVVKNTGGITSDKPGIEGLLAQGRAFMLQPGQTAEAQNKMVYETLKGLMTPVLPPFYRIFMSGIFPKIGTQFDGKQLGPWFYAPFLTSFVTPPFFGFLVGPSTPNRRKDGQPGGLLVEKCKFLQESGCKGLCLNQCKIPAQQFFQEELGLPLTVSPNFVTQECQWSFGEVPLPVDEDPSFPKGCLSGCESRKALAGTNDTLCN